MPRPKSRLDACVALVGVFFSLALGTLHAVPASPEAAELKQPDGTKVRLVKRGDEFFSWDETAEGYAVAKNGKDGFWEYARLATDRAEFRAMSGARVGASDPAKLGLRRGARPEASLLKEKIRAQRLRLQGNTQTVPGATGRAAMTSGLGTADGVTASAAAGVQALPSPPAAGGRTVRNIVILASFADHWDAAGNTVSANQGRTNTAEYSALFNTVGYHVNDAVGSVRDYYQEVSYGQFTVESIVVGWVKLPNNEAYYGNHDEGYTDANAQVMAADAINAADAAGFDFSQGDADGDGKVDSLTIIHSGHDECWGGAPASYIWSHQWWTRDPVTKDGVTMKNYCTVPALWGTAADTDIITHIGVTCHEMGHVFGLPDLYDYSGTTSGLGNWSLMAYGSWNGSYANSPAHLDAWSKWRLGFLTPAVVLTQPGVSLASVEDHPEVALIQDGCSNGEYFLVENRARVGFDNTSAIHPGLLIYHVDSKSTNNDLGYLDHPVVKIEEADGNNSLGNRSSRSEPGDVWTSTNGLPGGFRDQTGNAATNAMLYQTGSKYERSDAVASYSWIRMDNFSAAGAIATFDVATLRTGVRSQTVTSRDFTISWPACSTSGGYKVKEGTRVVSSSFFDGAEDPDVAFANWTMSGSAKRDNGAYAGAYCFSLFPHLGVPVGITLLQPFTVQAGTTISYHMLSNVSSGADLLCQISSDSGRTWRTLQIETGVVRYWPQRLITAAQIASVGIAVGDVCILRFVANTSEYASGEWGSFPDVGYAIDDIAISNTAISGYGNWTTVTAITPATSQAITGKANGVYAYRVRSYANGIWQPYGPVGEVTVVRTAYTDWAAAFSLVGAASEMVANPSGDGVANLLKFACNLNPNVADTRILVAGTGTAGLPVIGTTMSGGTAYLTVEYIRRKDAPELAYTVQVSSDLATWAPLAGTPTVTAIDAVWERVWVVDSVAAARRFARVQVTWTPAP